MKIRKRGATRTKWNKNVVEATATGFRMSFERGELVFDGYGETTDHEITLTNSEVLRLVEMLKEKKVI